MEIKNWSTSAGSNTSVNGVNIAEGCDPANINDAIRETMAANRAFYESPAWRDLGHTPTYVSASSFRLSGNLTGFYVVGQRIRMSDTSTLYGTISGSSYDGSTYTTVTVSLDSGSISASITAVALGAEITGKPIAAKSITGGFDTVTVGTDGAIGSSLTKEIAVRGDGPTGLVLDNTLGDQWEIHSLNSRNLGFYNKDAAEYPLIITSSGDVGLGSTPNFPLHVKGDGGANSVMSIGGVNGQIPAGFEEAGGVGIHTWISNDSSVVGIGCGNTNKDFILFNRDSTTVRERLRIDKNGCVLLGTSSVGAANAHADIADQLVIYDASQAGFSVNTSPAGVSNIFFGNTSAAEYSAYRGYLQYYHSDNTLRFGVNSAEAYRVTPTGMLSASQGAFTASTHHVFSRDASQTDYVASIRSHKSGFNHSVLISGSGDPGDPNANNATMLVWKSTITGRSINASGTVNASGADYAEYRYKADATKNFAKGSVLGVDVNGKLTDVFSDAHSFVIKSTDPSYVGGDRWHENVTVPKAGVEPTRIEATYDDDGEVLTVAETEEAFAVRHSEWETTKANYEAALEAERVKVDRVAFSGMVPVNVSGSFNVGDYIIAQETADGGIEAVAVAAATVTFEQYRLAVGKVWSVLTDGRPEVAVKVA